jgi:hypothetical protein
MDSLYLVGVAKLAVLAFVFAIVPFNFFGLWIRARIANAPLSLGKMVGMRLRKVPVGFIVDNRIKIIGVLAFVMFWVQPVFPHEQASAQAKTSLPTGNIENYRPGAMSIERIRQIGTIPSLNQGIEIKINNIATRLIAWPGQGMVEGAIHLLVSQITPPQLNLYEESGLFDSGTGTFNQAKINEFQASSKPGKLTAITDVKFRDTDSSMRAWKLDAATIRKKGALFNIFYGARFEGIGVPMVIILFPGYGTRNAGLHTGILPKGSYAPDLG